MADLISSGLTSKRLIYEHLAGNGLFSPITPSSVTSVWILSASILPQPGNIVGIWDDAEIWNDSPEVWYD